jgi:dihydroxyacetone kinase-like protein
MSSPEMTTAIELDSLIAWFRRFSEAVSSRAEELSSLDAAIGDADHGANLRRGCETVMQQLEAEPPGDIATFARNVGMTLISAVGGASGVLYGSFFLGFASSAGAIRRFDPFDYAKAWRAGVSNVVTRGKAQIGDKTMIDALDPATSALERAVAEQAPLCDALRAAANAAEDGMRSTVPLVARKGRASYLGERSAGHQDPGATSSWLLVLAAADSIGR